MKNNKPLRILAGFVGLALIIFLLIVTMSFTGNPISKLLATRAADKYVEDNYSDLNLRRQETAFEFKRGDYIVKYYKKNSQDIHFGIETNYLGKVTIDGYENGVLGKWNTLVRLNDELDRYAERVIRDNLDYDFDMVFAEAFGNATEEEVASKLQTDMLFDFGDLPLDNNLTIYIYEENRTWGRLAQVILEVDEVMEENNIDISHYSIILEEPREDGDPAGHSLGVYEFPREDLDSENLAQDLEDIREGLGS